MIVLFIPDKAVIEEKALEYEKGREILEKFKKFNINKISDNCKIILTNQTC